MGAPPPTRSITFIYNLIHFLFNFFMHAFEIGSRRLLEPCHGEFAADCSCCDDCGFGGNA